MKLWILRHGEAEQRAPSDPERALTPHGREEVLRSAARLIGERIDLILASPYLRAQQTAGLVHEALGLAQEVATVPWLTPEAQPWRVLDGIADLAGQRVLLVSHQPLVGNLLVSLCGDSAAASPMRTATLAVLEGQPEEAGMTLCALDHPD